MRPQIVKKILLTLFVHLLMFGVALGNGNNPPAPQPMGTPVPVNLPIDNGLIFLLIFGTALGLCSVFRKDKNDKLQS
jgi:hypothetical protein